MWFAAIFCTITICVLGAIAIDVYLVCTVHTNIYIYICTLYYLRFVRLCVNKKCKFMRTFCCWRFKIYSIDQLAVIGTVPQQLSTQETCLNTAVLLYFRNSILPFEVCRKFVRQNVFVFFLSFCICCIARFFRIEKITFHREFIIFKEFFFSRFIRNSLNKSMDYTDSRSVRKISKGLNVSQWIDQ